MFRVFLCFIVTVLLGSAQAHVSVIFDVVEGDDWCDVVNNVAVPGDIIRLAPGDYPGPCLIDRAPDEQQDEYTQVISLDPYDRAQIVYDGTSEFLVRVRGEQIMLVTLDFEGLPEGVPAIEVLGDRAIWIQYCNFKNLPGTAITVTAPVNGLYMLHNSFEQVGTGFELQLNTEKTVLDIGGNLFKDTSQMFEISGDWSGYIRNNIAQNVTQGMVVGPGVHATPLKIEGNWIQTEGTAIRVESGPAILRNNILQGGGIAWDLGTADEVLESVSIVGNSFVMDNASTFVMRGSVADVEVSNNLSLVPLPDLAGMEIDINGDCAVEADCWEFVEEGGFYPSGKMKGVATSSLADDFCGRPRAKVPTLGALEPACPDDPARFSVDFKDNFPCTFAQIGNNPDCPVSDDSGDTANPGVDPEDPDSCACGAAKRPVGPVWMLSGLLLFGWRRRS
jgi:hypothetical protein